jgi:hypothetical protein
MIMLDQGRVLRVGPRAEFAILRGATPETLQTDQERLIRQFLRGDSQGPLTDSLGLSEYEKLLVGGEESGIFRHLGT